MRGKIKLPDSLTFIKKPVKKSIDWIGSASGPQRLTIFILTFAVIGSLALLITHAASPNASIEPENGTLAGNASICSDANASGGACVKFASASSAYGPASPSAINANICGNATYLQSPYNQTSETTAGPNHNGNLGTTTAHVVVTASNFATVFADNGGPTHRYDSNTTFWFEPGVYTTWPQMQGQDNDIYVGEFSGGVGVTLNGNNTEQFGFSGDNTTSSDTVEYMEMKGFTGYAVGGGAGITGGPSKWTYTHMYLHDNGSGAQLGSNTTLTYNCLDNNGDYDFQGFVDGTTVTDANSLTGGPQNITVQHNEIARGDACNWEGWTGTSWRGATPLPPICAASGAHTAQGTSGGFKMWRTFNTTVTNNYFHDNYGVAAWWDTNNIGMDVENNYFKGDTGEGVFVEIGYNAKITHNTFINEGIFAALSGGVGSVMSPAVYVSETSAADFSSLGSSPNNTVTVDHNTFTDNWDAVSMYIDGNRFCGKPTPNDDWGRCTAIDNVTDSPTPGTHSIDCGISSANGTPICPTQYQNVTYWSNTQTTGSGCRDTSGGNLANATPTGRNPDYWDNCMWEVQHARVANNQFNFNAANVTAVSGVANACETNVGGAHCGDNALFSSSSGNPPWSNYANGNPLGAQITNCTAAHTFSGCRSMDNLYQNNIYTHTGTKNWEIEYWDQGHYSPLTGSSEWRTAGQDAGSTCDGISC